jgi:uncharacterized membrane protein (UPF0182 family)
MWIVIIIVVAIVVLLLGPAAATFYTQLLWFQSVNQAAVFSTVVSTQIALFLLGAGVFLVLAMVNLLIARSVAWHIRDVPTSREGVLTYIARMQARSTDRYVTFGAFSLALVISVIMGFTVSARWLMLLRAIHPSSFGVNDPLFGLDVSFFVFQLPTIRFLQGWLIAAIVLIGGLTGAYYAFRSFGPNVQGSDIATLFTARGVRVHFFTLLSLVAALLAAGYRLDAYDLDFAHRGVVYGAGYADRFAELPALAILGVVALIMALALFVTGFRKGFALAGLAVALWLVVAIVVGGVYPATVQQFQVQPSELAKELPYLKSNIEMTRQAFNLTSIDAQPFPGDPEPKAGVVERNPQTFDSIRLWDTRPLLSTYNQIQTIRLYYDFNNVDVDRYTIDGKYRQVMLSARELAPSKLSDQAQTWQTQRLQFTHGYGIAMSPVNEVTTEGLPNLFVKDVPVAGSIPIQRPEIYYGESKPGYVIVDTTAQEFDYPQGNQNVYDTYAGQSGVVLDSLVKKVAFAVADQDPNLLLTSYLTPSSRILYNRDISDRLSTLAPFLYQDPDPYLVVSNGHLYWIQDAYTVTDAYPYSTPYRDGFNYVRNSVKAVTDAYDGSIHLYVSDPNDPLIKTYEQIFPSLFLPMDKMPADLRSHVRYPEGIFLIQAEMLQAYHMQDPQVFYNREDLWDMPQEVGPDGQQTMQPYYVIMRLPGQDKEEFLLMLPFTPAGKTNMVAWLAAESDGANYGKMVVYDYPKDTVVFGPQQVEARIDQDARISQLLSLWNQQGSHVIRGNLLVLPIETSTLYVEPLYLQANQSQIPELKRVILATQTKLVIGSSLSEALGLLYGSGDNSGATGATTPDVTDLTGAAASPTPTPAPSVGTALSTSPTDVAALARDAETHYNRAQDALKAGNWATYGDEMQQMQADLAKLVDATKSP